MDKQQPLYKSPFFMVIALGLALAPFYEQSVGGFHSHLFQKVEMLLKGELRTTIDIFDLFMHGTPLAIWAASFIRAKINKALPGPNAPDI